MDAPLFNEIKEKTTEHVKILEELVAIKVLEKKPSFPVLVVVGDADSNKLNFVSKLVGIPLPDDKNRFKVPIILKFKPHNESSRKLSLTFYSSPAVPVTEDNLVKEMERLMGEIPGVPNNTDKCSSFEVTILQQQNVLDLTIVVLPGIQDHTNDKEVEFISGYGKLHTSGERCLLLQVLSAPTSKPCPSFKPYGTVSATQVVTAFTNVDSCPELKIKELTTNPVDIPLGHVFIISGENEADSESKFSMIDEKFLGYNAAADKVVTGLLSIIFSPSSMVTVKVKADSKETKLKKERFKEEFKSLKDALPTIVYIIGNASTSLENLFISKENSDETSMLPADELQEHFDKFYADLADPKIHSKGEFLKEEYMLLDRLKWERSADVFPPNILILILKKLLAEAAVITDDFIDVVFPFIDGVVTKVMLDRAEEFPYLHATLKMAAAGVTSKMKANFTKKVTDLLEMEGKVFLTCQPGYNDKWKTSKLVRFKVSDIENGAINIQGLGTLKVKGTFSQYDETKLDTAFQLKMRMASYWGCLVNRFADNLYLHLMLSIRELLTDGIKGLIADYLEQIVNDGNTNLVKPEPSKVETTLHLENRATSLDRLNKSIQKLQEHLVV